MTSYQRLKQRISVLEKDKALLRNELDVVCLTPDSIQATQIIAARKFRQDIMKGLAAGYGVGDTGAMGILNLIEK